MKYLRLTILPVIICISACTDTMLPGRGADARHFGSQAFSCYAKGDFQGAVKYYKLAYERALSNDLPDLQMKYLLNTGRVYYEGKLYDSAFKYFENVKKIMTFYGNTEGLSVIEGFFVLYYLKTGRNEYAAAIIEKKTGCKDCKVKDCFWQTIIAHYMTSQNNIDSALRLFDMAGKGYMKIKDYDALTDNYLSVSSLYYNNKKYDEAEKWLRLAHVNMEKADIQYPRFRILAALSFCEFHSGKRDGALIYYERALACKPKYMTMPSVEELESAEKLTF